MRSRLLMALVGAVLLTMPAAAEDKVPPANFQEVLIKTSLLTLNDANITANYAVLHAKTAKPFREQFSPERLKQVFKGFSDQKVDWGLIATMTPVATSESKVDQRGALVLHGYFDTKPNRLFYQLEFLPCEGEWKPSKLYVNLRAPQS